MYVNKLVRAYLSVHLRVRRPSLLALFSMQSFRLDRSQQFVFSVLIPSALGVSNVHSHSKHG